MDNNMIVEKIIERMEKNRCSDDVFADGCDLGHGGISVEDACYARKFFQKKEFYMEHFTEDLGIVFISDKYIQDSIEKANLVLCVDLV